MQTRQDRKLYAVAGLYFSGILAVLALELLDINIVTRLIGRISGYIS
jgi:hypothetical protein